MTTTARLRTRLRERGLCATLRKAVADHVYRRSTSVIVEFRAEWAGRGNRVMRPDWLSFAVLRLPGELPALGDWLAPRRDDFTAMLAAGKIGVMALDQGRAISCLWLSLADHDDPAAREHYAVRPREAYHYCWLTDPDSRRRNVTLPLCRFLLSKFGELGIDRTFGVVDRVNRASYLILRHFGYRERGVRVIHIHLLRWRWTLLSRYAGVLGTTEPGDRRMPRA